MSVWNHTYSVHVLKMFDVMRDVVTNSIQSSSPQVEISTESIKVPLHPHQQAVLYKMAEYEQGLMQGMDCSGAKLFSNYGILGDSVGAGKSLMVLSHISRLKALPPLQSYTSIGHGFSGNVFSLKTHTYGTDCSEAGCLIIVPHTLFRQWKGYIEQQTNLTAMYLDKQTCFTKADFKAGLLSADVVLISNTLYKELARVTYHEDIRWKRTFIDEADTIHIPHTNPFPHARFVWLITASWSNLLFGNTYYNININDYNHYLVHENAPYKSIKNLVPELNGSGNYLFIRFGMRSANFFQGLLNKSLSARSRLVIRCSDEFIKESISLPVLHRRVILCRAPLQQRVVESILPPGIAEMLHGGDTAGAIAALGVKTETKLTLVEAVTKHLKKELERLQATYEFKSKLEYATEASKKAALEALEAKIKQAQESIRMVEERVQAADEVCPICYDDMNESLMTPCCSRSFCAQCILTCLTRAPTCPMCRAAIQPGKLVKVVSSLDPNANTIVNSGEGALVEAVLPKKHEALLKLLEENPKGQFLLFSNYDNPFEEIEVKLVQMGIQVSQLKGNKDSVAATLRAFQAGKLRCLLLNSQFAGSGLNITAATHVVLLHAMSHEKEKQILGRAYRLGRTEPLQFIKILHENEQNATS